MITFVGTIGLIVLSLMCLSLLYIIILLNGRMYRYFKSIIDDERNQNAQLFDMVSQVLLAIQAKHQDSASGRIPNESVNRRMRRTDADEANL